MCKCTLFDCRHCSFTCIGVDSVPDKSKLENTLHFLECTHYCTQSSPQNSRNCILRLSISKCSGGVCSQTPTEKNRRTNTGALC